MIINFQWILMILAPNNDFLFFFTKEPDVYLQTRDTYRQGSKYLDILERGPN